MVNILLKSPNMNNLNKIKVIAEVIKKYNNNVIKMNNKLTNQEDIM
jgi:hypothetical protein